MEWDGLQWRRFACLDHNFSNLAFSSTLEESNRWTHLAKFRLSHGDERLDSDKYRNESHAAQYTEP